MENTQQTLAEAMEDSGQERVPRDKYRLRIMEAEFKQAKTKTNFYEFKCELINNPPIIVDGETIDVNGISGTKRFYLTPKTLSRFGALHKQIGLPLTLTLAQIIAAPNPTVYVGSVFNAICQTTDSPQLKEDGTPLLDSEGNQIVYSKFEIGDVA